MLPEHMDDGLTWAWALYWTASLEAANGGGPSPSTSLASSTGSTEAPEAGMWVENLGEKPWKIGKKIGKNLGNI